MSTTSTQKDIRDTALYREALTLCRQLRQPGSGQVSDAADLCVAADGTFAVFSGTLAETLEGSPPSRICEIYLRTGEFKVLTFGPNSDRAPKISPDGRHIAFLSDRRKAGDFQLHLLDRASGAVRSVPNADGWIEYLQWSTDGNRILLGVAGYGADIAGGQGAISSQQADAAPASWMPSVETGREDYRWRRVWVYDVATDHVVQASPDGVNVWEAVWCGKEAYAAVVSNEPGEGHWYSARLRLADRDLYVSRSQIGVLAASPSGEHLLVVESVCSDRGYIAGDALLIETASGRVRRLDTHGVDVAYAEWRSERDLLLAGHRGFETVVGLCRGHIGRFVEVWKSEDITSGGRFVSVSGLEPPGDFAMVGEGFRRAPEIACVRDGHYRSLKSFALDSMRHADGIAAVDRLTWTGADGLEIQGWLVRPKAAGPHPVVMNVHGGPIWHWRPRWLGRAGVHWAMLLRRGYAVFLPNPRGSSCRGQDFARRVVGDMGGQDTGDYLRGLDCLVSQGIADSTRLGVMGTSYGGFMTAWLITQDSRFAAAVAVSPVTNQTSHHLISNIPHFVRLFLADRVDHLGGKYFERSPVFHANRVKTPTLTICGSRDRCTPPDQGMQFHNALRESGVRSVLVTYPQEGHGIRTFPASIDYAARVVAWFEQYMPTGSPA
jgi:dipeptidyl aminopeptidase/acylaminoacyl peptidase